MTTVSYIDTCAGKFCRVVMRRDQMHRIKDRRGYFCPRCFTRERPRAS